MPADSKAVDLDMPLSVLMARWPATIPVFLRHKMLCVGCLVGPFHTVVDACHEHGVDQAMFIAALEQAMRLSRAPN